MNTLLTVLLLAASASAQGEGAAASPPQTEVQDTAATPGSASGSSAETGRVPRPSMLEEKSAKPEAAKAAAEAKPEAAPVAKPEAAPVAKPEAAPVAKPEAAPVPKAETAPEPKRETAASKPAGPDEEWAFAKTASEDADGSIQEAAVDELGLFIRRRSDSSQAPEAMLALAGLQQKRGDWQPAMAALLRLLYEYPSTKIGLRAKSDYLTLVDKKASRRQRQALNELVRLPESSDKADRLAALWQRLVEQAPDVIYEPAAGEIRDFSVRFPAHKDSDKLQASLARLHAANNKPGAALLAWRKLLALFADSALRPKAQLAIGDLYAESLRDPKRAIDAYQELAEFYPKSSELQGALESSARLFDEKLRQYALAVEMHEKLVAAFPKTAGSLRSFKAIAKLQRDRLQRPDDAMKTLTRLSSMHGGQAGIDALMEAAEIARRDLKDFARQAELLRKVSDDYASAREAPQALYDAADVYESSLKDNAKAIETYKDVASKFPSHKLARRASDRAAKLEPN